MPRFLSKYQNTVLIVSYHLPPLGGIPIMRALRLLRYLPEYGWNPTVLTSRGGCDFVHGFDEALVRKIPQSVSLLRIRDPLGFILKWLQSVMGRYIHQIDRLCKLACFPDEKVLWGVLAFTKTLNYFKKSSPDLIFATGYPWTSLLVGMWLKKALNKPLVIDLRDPWTLSPMPVWKKSPLHRKLEHKIMKAADAVVFTSENTTETYQRHYPHLAEKMLCVPNGFDPQDFESANRQNNHKKDQRFRMIYAGSLGDAVPPKERTRSLAPLLKSLQAFKKKYPPEGKRLVFDVYSNDIPNTRELAKNLDLTEVVNFLPRLSHHEIVEKMLQANVGVLITQGSPDGRQIVPAKLYEYIAAGLPVLALCPDSSETAGIINRYQLGYVFNYQDQPGDVADTIYQLLIKKPGRSEFTEAQKFYNGINLVGKFADCFDNLVKKTIHEAVAS